MSAKTEETITIRIDAKESMTVTHHASNVKVMQEEALTEELEEATEVIETKLPVVVEMSTRNSTRS